MTDFKLSSAYDLLNSSLHIEDKDFAIDDRPLPKSLAQGKINQQIKILSDKAEINTITYNDILKTMLNQKALVEKLSFPYF